jgi:hypothetical protein
MIGWPLIHRLMIENAIGMDKVKKRISLDLLKNFPYTSTKVFLQSWRIKVFLTRFDWRLAELFGRMSRISATILSNMKCRRFKGNIKRQIRMFPNCFKF